MNSCIMDKVNNKNNNNLSNLKTNNNITSATLSLWHVAALEIDKYDGSTLHTCCWTVSLDVINFNFHLLLITLYPLQHTLYLPLSFPFNKLKCQKRWQCRIVSSAPRSAVWGASWAYENDCHRHFWHLANTIRQQLLLPGRQRDRQTDRETGRQTERQADMETDRHSAKIDSFGPKCAQLRLSATEWFVSAQASNEDFWECLQRFIESWQRAVVVVFAFLTAS